MSESYQGMGKYPVDLKWEEPGDKVDDLYLYRDVIRQVEKRPGMWARIRVMSQGSAYSTRKRLMAALDGDPRWEVKVARVSVEDPSGNLRGLYLRYRTNEQMEMQG